jgi:hypothetical protein
MLRSLLLVGMIVLCAGAAAVPPETRGYYLIPTRVQTWDLGQWRDAFDCFAEDGANTVVFWIAGGFRSKLYPETWRYNREHLDVGQDFVRELIDYAHEKGVRVLLGLSPFAYDGVNQYSIGHPETRAKNADGTPIGEGGIFCMGYSLCPAVDESQRFMLGYATEMLDDFYPNADGLFIESTDYGRCQCERCKGHYYEDEFRFVRAVSDHLWARKPEATVVVYPHYFVAGDIGGAGVKGVGGGQGPDPRFTLFFTPHSADANAPQNRALMVKARESWYWDMAPIFGGPAQVRDGARTARRLGARYVPTLEAFAYPLNRPEFPGGEFLVGHRLRPCGLEWLPPDRHHYRDPLVRLNRLAYREFTRDPELEDGEFRRIVRKEMFGAGARRESVDDLYFLVDTILGDRQSSFLFASPIVMPRRLEAKAMAEKWPRERVDGYKPKVEALRRIEQRLRGSGDPVERQMHNAAAYVVKQWDDAAVGR